MKRGTPAAKSGKIREKFYLTFNPGGYLRRTDDGEALSLTARK